MEIIYKRAALVLKRLQRKEGSLKSLVFSTKSNDGISFRKQVYAIVAETLKRKVTLLKVIEDIQLLEKEPKLTINLALVLTYEFLFGKGVKCGGSLKYYVARHKTQLQQSLENLAIARETSETVHIPRYIRVNLLKTTIDEVISKLRGDGFRYTTNHPMSAKEFSIDHHLSDVVVLHSSVDLSSHPLYQNSHIILQDKASCLSSFLLAPPPGSCVIDCCAAPGNKTTHLASLMNNQGTIHAFDKDEKRFAVLKRRLREAGATCVLPVLCDFLEVNSDNFHDTEYILVDPSCSGSGITNRLDYHTGETKATRLRSLASFQLRMLKHALEFPSVKKVVYSTCSIHKEENEMVVQKALEEFGTKYVLDYAMPEWAERGLAVFDGAERCVRSSPQRNATNGFFIAVFQHKDLETKHQDRNITEPTNVHVHVQKQVKAKRSKRYKRTRKVPVTIK